MSILIAGGQMNLDHLKKVNLDVYLKILRRPAVPNTQFISTAT
jgi:hypothetical protein